MAFPLPETNLFRFLLVLCINYSWFRKQTDVTVGLSLKTTSITNDVIDWPIPNKLLIALLPGNPTVWQRQKVVPRTKYKI